MTGQAQVSSDKNIFLNVKVQPGSRKQELKKIGERAYKLHVISPPSEGKANKEAIAVLASNFNLPPSRVKILKGHRSRKKIVVLQY
jgi:uncharacterized protein (TIGR00251 family)